MNPHTAAMRRLNRQGWGLILYRIIFEFAFLIAAFSAFPSYKALFALGLLVFFQATEGVGIAIQALFVTGSSTGAEQALKTRYTITVAQTWALRGRDAAGAEFWREVDSLVLTDQGEDDFKPSWLKSLGLVLWNIMSRGFWDLIIIGIAAALTPSY